MALLERARLVSGNGDSITAASINYRLSLIYRNASAVLNRVDEGNYLNKALECARAAHAVMNREKDQFRLVSAKIGLGNCLGDRFNAAQDIVALREAITFFKEAISIAKEDEECAELLPHAYNSLGSSLSKFALSSDTDNATETANALTAFNNAIRACEDHALSEVWGAAQVNRGLTLAIIAQQQDLDVASATFLRIQAIAAFQAAIEIYPANSFPLPFAEAHYGLAHVLKVHALRLEDDLEEFYLFRAVQSFEAAAHVFTEDHHPDRWVQIQIQLGNIFGIHAQLEGVKSAEHDFDLAKTYFENALRYFESINSESDIDACKQALGKVSAAAAEAANVTSSSVKE